MVIRTFGRPTIGPILRIFNKAGADWVHLNIVPFLIQRFRSADSMIKESTMPADAQILCQVSFPGTDDLGEVVFFGNLY